jgi:hypothetical protein
MRTFLIRRAWVASDTRKLIIVAKVVSSKRLPQAEDPAEMIALDPAIALSATGAIVRSLNFGIMLLERGYRIHSSLADDYTPLDSEKLIFNLSTLHKELRTALKTSIGYLTKDEQALEDLSRVISKVADDLLIRLDRIKAAEEQSKDRSDLRESLKKAWVKKDLDTLSRRLSTLKLEIEKQIVPFLK